ncbi:MAG: type I DNA topoisomerase [Spirosomataceae bacterium]
MSKNLVIVESPAKAKTIEGYLGKDFIVKSSFGHVRDLPKDDKAIDIKNGYKPVYEISPEKIQVVNELKKIAKQSEDVWLATDDDREGEAISWHLKEALGLKDNTKRIVFREITKNAILKAIQKPRQIDMDLVNAQQARRILDRLIGFELSPVLWDKIKAGLSAGRVQSVAVRLVVERERDIENFNTKSSYKITALFDLAGGKTLSAELPKNFETEKEAVEFLEKCKGAQFKIKGLETKPAKKSPAPPFTTSTLQQEASRKLNYSVAQTMTLAQKLYESGKISYMRTDSTNLSEEAIGKAKSEITTSFGSQYSNPRQYKTKSESAQEAHEAIRPTDFSVNQAGDNRNEQRLYELIWKRAIASQMADAQLERTIATISISTVPQELIATGEVIKFDGFLKVYLESKDDEDEESKGMLPPLTIGQVLELNNLKATERFSRPAARYTEASLVKQLEEMGIGRPSTYAPTISTIIKREYVVKEDRPGKERSFNEYVLKSNTITSKTQKETYGTEKAKLFPTSIGMVVNDFLVEHFDSVVNYSFTASMEREFDEIAEGKIQWGTMIDSFYQDFHKTIEKSQSAKFSSESNTRHVGIDPTTGKPVSVRMGKFGPYAQIGETENGIKPRYAPLKKGQLLSSVSLEEVLDLFKLPREVGFYEEKPLIVGIGKLGPYVRHDEKFYSLGKDDDPLEVTEERCIELIEDKRKTEGGDTIGTYEGKPLITGKGKYGPYVKHDDKYYSLSKSDSLVSLSQARAIEIIEQKRLVESNKFLKEFPENESVKVVNGMYGPYIAIGKRNIKIPKDKNPAELTLADCLALAEEAPATKNKPTRKK